jgi:hypothetical protein
MAAPPLERRLAAIFAADVADYSRRPMHGGEEATMAKLSARLPLIDQLTTVSKERVGNPMAASTTKTLYD